MLYLVLYFKCFFMIILMKKGNFFYSGFSVVLLYIVEYLSVGNMYIVVCK